ncbi:hypothetical protein KY334_00015 [Candidatus Woesearchaeota archaeon]|nr:hypothetical protein [Candidatus Woesearchaeota archaeon]
MPVSLKNYLKKLIRKTKENKSRLSFFLEYYYFILLFFKKQNKKNNSNKKIAAIVLSWKRPKNLPFVIYGLKKQSCIDKIIILHNHPSKRWIPRCKNIFFEENHGCIIRHKYAAEIEGFDYFLFSDDDLMLKHDVSKVILNAINLYGEESMYGFFGQKLNLKSTKPYSQGTPINSISRDFVDIIKGRLHIISKEGIKEMTNSNLDTPALLSEDDIRANIILQMKFNKANILLPLHKNPIDLQKKHALERRKNHLLLRDEAILDGIKMGWSPIRP